MNFKTLKSIIFISCFCGLLFAVSVYIICRLFLPEDAVMLSLNCGLLFALCLYLYLIAYRHFTYKRYEKAEKNITSPVFYKFNGNFNLGNELRNGNIYFCEAGIVFISLDKKPYAFEGVSLTNILKYEFGNNIINIYTNENRVFIITSPEVNQVLSVLKENGWVECD